jgi:hypothetical protein
MIDLVPISCRLASQLALAAQSPGHPLDSPHFPERVTIAQYSRATHFDCGQDRLTAQVEYVEMMERKAVQVFYPADHANGDAPRNEPTFVYRSLLFHICDHLLKEQFDPSHLIGLEGT